MAEPKTVAIIGAGPGLGSALARRFAHGGWSVALVSLRQDVIDAGLAELEESRVSTCGAQADVADRGPGIQRAFGSIVDALGVPDVVIYNASIYQAEAALELSHEALRLALDIHVVGARHSPVRDRGDAGRRSGGGRVYGEQPGEVAAGDVGR